MKPDSGKSRSSVSRVRRAPASDRARIPLWNNLIAWSLGGLAWACLLLNAVDVVFFPAPFLYMASLVLTLAVAMTNFVAIAVQKLL